MLYKKFSFNLLYVVENISAVLEFLERKSIEFWLLSVEAEIIFYPQNLKING